MPKGISVKQVAALFVLSSYSQEENMLGEHVDLLFVEEEALSVISKFQEELDAIGKSIKERGDWDHLHPKKVPNSTAI